MTQAEKVIARFGGVCATARALGHKHASTVQGWKKTGFIPGKHHETIWNAARELNVGLEATDFLTISEGRH